MGKKRGILLAAVLAAFLGGLVWPVLRPREPVYEGKRLGLWLEEALVEWETGWATPDPRSAGYALRQIGTNAIPMLLRMLRARDSTLTLKLVELAQKQHVIKIKYIPASVLNVEVIFGFEALGAIASNAVPGLIEMYDRCDPSESLVQGHIAQALGYMGPPAKAAIPSLLRRARDTDEFVRANTLWALGTIHAQPDQVVPALIKALSDSSPTARANAAYGLGNFGTAAWSAVPALIQLLNETDENKRPQTGEVLLPLFERLSIADSFPWEKTIKLGAERALKQIDPEAAAKAGVK